MFSRRATTARTFGGRLAVEQLEDRTAPAALAHASLWATADFNRDGHLDVLTGASSRNVSVLLGRGDGSFQPVLHLSRNAGYKVVADFPGHGGNDVVVVHEADNEISVSPAHGDGTAVAVLGDFAGKGHLDLVTAHASSNDVSVLLARD